MATAPVGAVQRSHRNVHLVSREIAVIGIAGAIVGVLVGGLGSRIFMRIAGAVAPDAMQGATTEAGARIGEITFGGTIALVVFVGIPTGIIGAALAVIFFPWLTWAGRWRGVAFGVVLFALASATSDVMNPDNVDFLLIRNGWLMVLTILALFVAFGAALDAAVRALDRHLPSDEAGARFRALYAVTALVGFLLVASLAPIALFTRSFCSCDPPITASTSTIVAGAGTVLLWVAGPRSARSRAAALAPYLGYAGVVGTLGFGLIRVVRDASDIVIR